MKSLLFCVIFTAIIALSQSRGKRDNVYFYVYDWPEDIIDCWPVNFTHKRLSVERKFKENFGMGPLRSSQDGVYHTHQYSLFAMFYQRLLESEFRTTDPKQASYFFIPYDIGMDSSTRKSDGALFQTNCPRMSTVIQYLSDSPYFGSGYGNNHFILHSINQPMQYYLNLKCREFYDFCFNCTKLSIDTYPPNLFKSLSDWPSMTNRWVSIPFPANL